MDLEDLRLSLDAAPRRPAANPYRHKASPFIKGPIDLNWILRAMSLAGSASNVGILLHYYRGLNRGGPVDVSMRKLARDIGCSRDTVVRAMHVLESAELVAVVRRPGRRPRITIVEVAKNHETQPWKQGER